MSTIAALTAAIALAIACGSEDAAPPAPVAEEAETAPPAKPPAPEVSAIIVPSEAGDPPWLASREQQQRELWQGASTFHDFTLTDRLPESGITFAQQATADSGKDWIPVHYDHGNSVSVADVDGDGLLDVLFTTQIGNNGLWRNKGDGTFEDITWSSMKGGLFDKISVAGSFADMDNDGDADLYVTTVRGGNVLYENDGSGVFEDVTDASGLGHVGHSGAAVLFDYNKDGLLDVFLLNIGRYTSDQKSPHGNYYVGLKDGFAGHVKPERNEPHILFENKGGNRFEDVSEKVGLEDTTWSGAALPVDFDGDGWTDLYIVNMQGLDAYYENDGGKRFVRRDREVFPRTSWGAMGAQSFDYDNDGDMDLYVTDMHSDMPVSFERQNMTDFDLKDEQTRFPLPWPPSFLQDDGNGIPGNTFFRNDGEGRFVEVSDEIGTENFWPWGLSAGDLNADGFEDVFIASSMNFPWRYGVNSLKLNIDGKRFQDAEFVPGVEPRRDGVLVGPWFEIDCSGADSAHTECEGRSGTVRVSAALGSRSSAVFDLDGDGDLDIVTNEFNSAPMVLVSDLSEKKEVRFLEVSLVGSRSNRDGLGATVTVKAGDRTYTRYHDGQSGYLAQSRMPLYFGLGDAAGVDSVTVRWPSGEEQTVTDVDAGSRLVVREGA